MICNDMQSHAMQCAATWGRTTPQPQGGRGGADIQRTMTMARGGEGGLQRLIIINRPGGQAV